MSHQPTSQDSTRLPISTKAAWGVGGMVDNLMMNGAAMLLLPIYNIALGVNPIWLGYAMLLPRLIDVIIDPMIGNWSDNASTRWGRRRPFIAVGGIIAAIACVFLWMPPLHWDKNGLLAYAAFFSTALCAGYALFSIPWSALGYELTTDFHERTRVMAWRLYFAYAGGLALPWLYKLALLPIFSPQDTGGFPNEVYGVRWVAGMVAVVCLAAALIPAWFCREPVQLVKQPHTSMREALALTFSNGPFLLLSGVVVVVISGLILSGPFLLYLNIYYVTDGNKDLAGTLGGWGGTLGTILGFASTPLLVAMATRIGKKNAMLIGQGAAMVGYALSWFCITPAMPYLQLLPAILIFPGLNSVWLLSQSVMADICDIDELRSGKRREGMFGAAMALIFKFSMAFAPVLVGYMLFWSGFRENLSAQSESTIFAMRIFYAGIPVVCLAISLVLTSRLPISEKDAHEVRRLLEERKKSLP